MCYAILAKLAMIIHCVLFMRHALLVRFVASHLLRNDIVRHHFLSFISCPFLLYMKHLVSVVLQVPDPVSRLHGIQCLYREIACLRLHVWVSIICGFLLCFRLVFPFFRSPLRYRGSFPTRYNSSLTCGPVRHSIDYTEHIPPTSFPYGGAGRYDFAYKEIAPFVVQGDMGSTGNLFRFVVHGEHIGMSNYDPKVFVHTNVPLCNIIHHLSIKTILNIAHIHGIKISSHVPKAIMVSYFNTHHCAACNNATTIFSVVKSRLVHDRIRKQKPMDNACVEPEMTVCVGDSIQQGNPLLLQKLKDNHTTEVEQKRHRGANHSESSKQSRHVSSTTRSVRSRHTTSSTSTMPIFPPSPPDNKLMCDITRDFCFNSSPDKMEEAGCAVCGQLTPSSKLTRLKSVKQCLRILQTQGVTRVERKHSSKPIHEFKGPVLDYKCNRICDNCRKHLRKGNVPRNALANGLWIGAVPDELSGLKFMERLLIARIRINSCFVRVAASGLRRMTSHVIAFESLVPKIYHRLPPPVEDLEEMLAILFTGPCLPTEKDYQRTPLLVRCSYVARALEWLKLNNTYYADLEIAYDKLEKYPENSPPVTVEYRKSLTTKIEEGTSSFDNGEEVGVDDGECPFVVHGLMNEQYKTMSVETLKGIALRHWNNGGGALAVSHSVKSKSIYNNPGLYPQAFPWLFPYGLGGVGSTALSDKAHKRFLLMYHDKRFQCDVTFPFVAFSHLQMKAASSAGFLLADSSKFHDIANRLLSVNQGALASISKRLCYDPGPYHQFSVIFHHLFHALGHSFSHSFPHAPLGPPPNHLTNHLMNHLTIPQSIITCHHSAVRSIPQHHHLTHYGLPAHCHIMMDCQLIATS